jgi:hypothetical protein
MRRLGNTVRFGFVLALTVAVVGVVAATPAAAQAEPPNAPLVVIPGGPPFVLSGPYSGSASSSAGDFPCPPASAPIRADMSGLFTHPSLGSGAYEFRLRVCVPTEATSKGAILLGTFVLNGNKQFLSAPRRSKVSSLCPVVSGISCSSPRAADAMLTSGPMGK